MSDPILEIRGLARRYGTRQVLAGVDLALPAGARLTVAGRSGVGKSTLLRLVAGLESPDAGEIRLAGRLASRAGATVLPPWCRGVQMVFQDLALWPTRSVQRHLVDPLRAHGVPRAAAAARATAMLARLGLAALVDRRPGRLSGGEARRLAFARALVLEPQLLLLDEPFASLDPVARAAGFELLEEVLAATKAAVVMVTHDPAEARALGGGVAVLRDGAISAIQPCGELCANENSFRTALES
ncbi:MAG TPA: ATP-binding cassette domain-containing protein [Planctomycetota bacterium]